MLQKKGLSDTTLLIVRNETVGRYLILNSLDSAMLLCKENMQLLRSADETLGKYRFRVLLALGDVFAQIDNSDSAIFYFKKAVSERLKFPAHDIQRAYYRLGIIYRKIGDYESAVNNFQKSFYVGYLNTKKKTRQSLSYASIGDIYSLQGNFQLGLQNYLAALALSEEIADSMVISSLALNIGANHFRLKNYQKAMSYYFKSLKLANRLKHILSLRLAATACMNISEVYSLSQRPDSAIFYAKKSVDYNKSSHDKNELAYSLHYLSLAYRTKGIWQSAIAEEKKAYTLHLESHDKNGCAESLQGLSEIYLALGNYRESLSQAALALNLAIQINTQPIQKDVLRIMAQTSYQLGRYSKANRYWQSYDSLNEILYNKERLQQFTNLEALYETNKKVHEIKLLTQRASLQELEIQQQKLMRNFTLGGAGILLGLLSIIFYQLRLKRKNVKMLALKKNELEERNSSLQKVTDKLEKALTDKDLLLKETHHRVKNNLQIINSLLNLQKDNDSSDSIKAAQGRILSMSLIHQRLYKQENLIGVEFLSYAKELMHLLEKMYSNPERNVLCIVEGENFMINADTAIPLGLILLELITNSFKHSFNHTLSGRIQLEIFHADSNLLTIDYHDSGPGIPTDFDPSKNETLGMKLILNLTAQLEGQVTFSNENGYRAKFVFNNVQLCSPQKSAS